MWYEGEVTIARKSQIRKYRITNRCVIDTAQFGFVESLVTGYPPPPLEFYAATVSSCNLEIGSQIARSRPISRDSGRFG